MLIFYMSLTFKDVICFKTNLNLWLHNFTVATVSMITNLSFIICIVFNTLKMSKYALQQESTVSRDIYVAAQSLLQLKMSDSLFDNSPISMNIYSAVHHNTGFSPTVSLQAIVGTIDCAWTKLFDKVQFELHYMRDIIVNIFPYNNDNDKYPNIDQTFQHMKDLYSNGYLVINMATMIVIHEL